MARATLENFVARAIRLCEQEPSWLGEYVRRWSEWVWAGLPTGGDRGASGLAHVSVGGAVIGLWVDLVVAGFVDVEVHEFHG